MAVIKLGKGTDEVELFEAADGRRLVITTIKTPVCDAEGEIIGLQGIFWDITAEKQAEEALAARQERFELAVRGSNDGIWDWNIPTGEVYFSDRFKELLGHEPDGFDNLYESFESRLHPDDHDAIVAAIESHLKVARALRCGVPPPDQGRGLQVVPRAGSRHLGCQGERETDVWLDQ